MQLKWMNADHTVLQVKVGPKHYKVVEPGMKEWTHYSSQPDIAEYQPPSQAEIDAEAKAKTEQARLTAYKREADPLFFKWQAGEATEQEWLDARNAVRERYPYPE